MNPVNPKGGGGLSVGLVSAGEVKPATPREPVSNTRSSDSNGSSAAAETDSPAAVVSVNPQKVVTGSQQSSEEDGSDREEELERERKLREREAAAAKREESVRSDTRVSFGQIEGSPGELIFQVKQGDEVVISYPKDQDKSKLVEANLEAESAQGQPVEEQSDRRLDAVA